MTSDEKLLLLAPRLRAVPPAQFDLETWGTVSPQCDTICCAVGHATFMPEFQALGLSNYVADGHLIPVYEEQTTCVDYGDSIEGICDFFGISYQEFLYLFTEDDYNILDGETQILPSQVADRIEEFVRRRNAKVVPRRNPTSVIKE